MIAAAAVLAEGSTRGGPLPFKKGPPRFPREICSETKLMTPPDSPSDASHTRRAAFAVLGGSLLALALAACSGLKPRQHAPGERSFWQREEQRDD